MTTLYYYIIIRNILNIRLKKVWLVGTVPENPQRHTTQPREGSFKTLSTTRRLINFCKPLTVKIIIMCTC